MSIATFYNENMFVSDKLESSPGLWKAKRLVNMIEGDPICDLRSDFKCITHEQLLYAHDRGYVDDVLSRVVPNGHGNFRQDVLDVVLWQNSSFVAAVEHALNNQTCAFSPTSGFHHAGFDYGGGFCTFNALMIAAKLAQGKRVLIIDGDAHFGDGCVSIMEHVEFKNVMYRTISKARSSYFFSKIVETALESGVDLVLYQAGADSHEDDVYGAGQCSTAEMINRDTMIFEFCRKNKIPIVWNLAGGYGAPEMSNTIQIHYNTWCAARTAYA